MFLAIHFGSAFRSAVAAGTSITRVRTYFNQLIAASTFQTATLGEARAAKRGAGISSIEPGLPSKLAGIVLYDAGSIALSSAGRVVKLVDGEDCG
jgi:cytosine/adenosine deaminase-related metal-dependent hydrolase